MATYLVVTEDELPRITIAEGKHVYEALEGLKLEDGEAVIVCRVASKPRKVTVETETVRKLRVV